MLQNENESDKILGLVINLNGKYIKIDKEMLGIILVVYSDNRK